VCFVNDTIPNTPYTLCISHNFASARWNLTDGEFTHRLIVAAMKRNKYTPLDAMTKRCKGGVEKASCLATFNDLIHLEAISGITYSTQRTDTFRHDCLVRMAYFITLSACTQLFSCLDKTTVFEFDDALKSTVHYGTAVSSMFLLAELLTVPNYSTQFKLRNVEKAALAACACLCQQKRIMMATCR